MWSARHSAPTGRGWPWSPNDGPAVHVWDLRNIRRCLDTMGLDWDATAYADADPADATATPLPPLQVDLGPLAGELEHFTAPAETLIDRYTARIRNDPNDSEAYYHAKKPAAVISVPSAGSVSRKACPPNTPRS
jgi:hypothetical protein